MAFVLCIHLFGQGITIGYHRLLTHRSFKTPKWLEHWIAILGICSMQDTPARWVCVHRIHHVHSDEIPDPHSPRVSFLWSHMGWLMFINREAYSLNSLQKFAKDLLRDPFYMRLETNPYRQFFYILGQIPVFFLLGGLAGLLITRDITSAIQLASSAVVWCVIMRVIAVWHITWSVNSLSHMFGYQTTRPTRTAATTGWSLVSVEKAGTTTIMRILERPAEHRWWEFDFCYYEIKLLEKLGLASDVVATRQQRRSEQVGLSSTTPPRRAATRELPIASWSPLTPSPDRWRTVARSAAGTRPGGMAATGRLVICQFLGGGP